MDSTLFWTMVTGACLFMLLAVTCYVRSPVSSLIEWSGRARVVAGLSLAVGLFLAGIAQHLYDLHLPLTESVAYVDSVHMQRHGAEIVLRLPSNDKLDLKATNNDSLFAKRCEPYDPCYLTSTPLFIRPGQQLDVQYLARDLISASTVSPNARHVEIYRDRRALGNIWVFAAMIALIFGPARSKPLQWRPQAKVGDNVAERFTPDDLPGAHWKFVETPTGFRFATEEEKLQEELERKRS